MMNDFAKCYHKNYFIMKVDDKLSSLLKLYKLSFKENQSK